MKDQWEYNQVYDAEILIDGGGLQTTFQEKKKYSKPGSGALVAKSRLTLCDPMDRSLPGLEKTISYISGDRD